MLGTAVLIQIADLLLAPPFWKNMATIWVLVQCIQPVVLKSQVPDGTIEISRKNMPYMTVLSGSKSNCFHLQLVATATSCKQAHTNTVQHKKQLRSIFIPCVYTHVMWLCSPQCKQNLTESNILDWPLASAPWIFIARQQASVYGERTRSSADADNALDANEAGIRVIRGVPNFRKSITW